jgi:hypothetical protein
VIVLAIYAALVPVYLYFQYWGTPEYEAAEHLEIASQILGRSGGRGIKRAELTRAYEHLLEVARIFNGDEATLHDLEELNARFEEKRWQLPDELRHRAEALGMLARKNADEDQPIMAVGLRQRGWDPEAIKAGPGHALWGALIGAVLISIIYASIRFSVHRVHEQEHVQELLKTEKEVAELGEWRQGLKTKGIEEPKPKPKSNAHSSPPPRAGKEPIRPVNVGKRPK